MKKYWDRDEGLSYFFRDEPTPYCKKPIEIDQDLFEIYESIERSYWMFQEWFEKEIKRQS